MQENDDFRQGNSMNGITIPYIALSFKGYMHVWTTIHKSSLTMTSLSPSNTTQNERLMHGLLRGSSMQSDCGKVSWKTEWTEDHTSHRYFSEWLHSQSNNNLNNDNTPGNMYHSALKEDLQRQPRKERDALDKLRLKVWTWKVLNRIINQHNDWHSLFQDQEKKWLCNPLYKRIILIHIHNQNSSVSEWERRSIW